MISQLDFATWVFQIASCLFMTGVILVIQLIHYPGFKAIAADQFHDFHQSHTKALGYIAAPVMCLELGTAVWLAKTAQPIPLLNLAGVVALWIVTFFASVPAHSRLALGFDESAWRRLLRTNWIRTIIWSVRSGILIFYAIRTWEFYDV